MIQINDEFYVRSFLSPGRLGQPLLIQLTLALTPGVAVGFVRRT
jgi:hypothetical protein